MDWGSAAPFAVYWGAISDGQPLPDGRVYPRGSMVVYREWYGAKGANVGIRMTAEAVAEGIVERTPDKERRDDFVIDPAAFAQTSGPSIAERMMSAGNLTCRRADNKRIPGWDQLRARLLGDSDGPGLYFFATCQHAIRTLPALQHDQTNAEDVDTDGEDHAADALRYLVMTRPYVRHEQAISKPREGWCLDDLWADAANNSR